MDIHAKNLHQFQQYSNTCLKNYQNTQNKYLNSNSISKVGKLSWRENSYETFLVIFKQCNPCFTDFSVLLTSKSLYIRS